ncbi:acyl-CoA thioesterase [Prochlorococcus sp. MIT 1307]|uniref:acyl-CoA thioesterase n=1 Tax=Prochlorococcus sp. MIT 1307 TaxID=3096219 RepID=UPI002A75E857|nr:acyl-CoA thioesterase [Prochlorococcus sp. MIT 1307]
MTENAEHWLLLSRVVRFGDSDAAGVIHFHNLLRWCHEAWEESLEKYGLHSSDFFPGAVQDDKRLNVALPIVHCKADFRSPIKTGDHLEIILSPEKIDISSFQIQSRFQRDGENVALGLIRHLAINVQTRQRCALPEKIDLWLESSSLHLGPRPL